MPLPGPPCSAGAGNAPPSLRARSARLGVGALAGLAAVFLAWRALPGTRATLDHVQAPLLPLYLALVLLIVVLHALRWRAVLLRLGATAPSLPRLVQLWLAGRAVGSLIPSGTLAGEPVRAYLLGTGGIPSAAAAGAVTLDRTLELAGNMIAGPACVGAALALGAGSLAGTAAASLTALAGLALFGFVYVRALQGAPALAALLGPPWTATLRPRRQGAPPGAERPVPPGGFLATLRAHLESADEALHRLLRDHPRLVPAGLALSLAIEGLHLLELAVLYATFGLAVPLALLLLSSVGIGVARTVPVSAALGSLEATQVGIFALGGRTLAEGLSVALVLRLAETLWIFVGLGCLAAASAAPREVPP